VGIFGDFSLAHLVERFAEMAHDVELVEQDGGLGKTTFEDMVLVERSLVLPTELAKARAENEALLRPRKTSAGSWSSREFPSD
jgi:hypothetical protein